MPTVRRRIKREKSAAHGGKRASHNVYRVNYSNRNEANDGSSRAHHRRYQASRFALVMVA